MKSKSNEKRKETDKKVKSALQAVAERDLIKRQQGYRKSVLARLYRGAELIEMRKQIEDNMNKGTPILMQWYGMPYPLQLLVIEHDITQNVFGELLTEENKLKEELMIVDKLTPQEVKELLEQRKFIKEVRK